MKKSKIIILFICIISLFSCENSGNNDAYQPHIYIVGGNYDIFNSILWTNNVVTEISKNESGLTSLFLSNGKVYLTGYEYDRYGYHATVWENGSPTMLSQTQSCAYSVFVRGSVYVAGYEQGYNTFFATLWIDGTATRLSSSESLALSVDVSDGNIYVVGSIKNTDGKYNAVVWKNGIKTILSSNPSTAHSVFVKNKNIYIAGVENNKATLWTNNVAETLSNDYSTAFSVFAANNKVYVAGHNENIATLWENGVPTTLDTQNSSANSVFVSGTDVYVAGITDELINHSCGYPTLWLNGNKEILSYDGITRFIEPFTFYVSGIFVK
ncbi:MAG: hypothetical protein LBS50_09820 [Prevotellaceae bacterium]|jgi:hypothetical protein|nr:hypothetical protein [Prevotellaceae bacterium]